MTARGASTSLESLVAAPQHPYVARQLLTRAEQARKCRRELLTVRFKLAEEGVRRASWHADYEATAVLHRALGELGCWPDQTLVGPDAARAAVQIAVRSDHLPDLQRTALRLLRSAMRAGTVPAAHWARLTDRCRIRADQLQRYGTQYRLGEADLERMPVSDPDGLDARRAEVGLPPAVEAWAALRRRLPAVCAAVTDDELQTVDLTPRAA